MVFSLILRDQYKKLVVKSVLQLIIFHTLINEAIHEMNLLIEILFFIGKTG